MLNLKLVVTLCPLLVFLFLSEKGLHGRDVSYNFNSPYEFKTSDTPDEESFDQNFIANDDTNKGFIEDWDTENEATGSEAAGTENNEKEDPGKDVIVEEIKDESGEEPEGKEFFKITPMLEKFKPGVMKSKGTYDLTTGPGPNSEIYYGNDEDYKKATKFNPFSKLSSLKPFQTMKKGISKARNKMFSKEPSEEAQSEPKGKNSRMKSFKKKIIGKFKQIPGKFNKYTKRMKEKFQKDDISRDLGEVKGKYSGFPAKLKEASKKVAAKFKQSKLKGAANEIKGIFQKVPVKFKNATEKMKVAFQKVPGKFQSEKYDRFSKEAKRKFAKIPKKFKTVSDKAKAKFKKIPNKFNQASEKFSQLPSKFYGKIEPLTSGVKAGYSGFKEKAESYTPFQSLLREFQRAITPPNQERATQNALAVKDTLEKEDQWKNELVEALNKMTYFDLRKLKPHKNWLFGDFVAYKEADVHTRNCKNDQQFLRAVGQLRKMSPEMQSHEVFQQLCLFPFYNNI